MRRAAISALLAAALLAAIGCGGRENEGKGKVFTDSLGRTVKLKGPPRRIVSMAPSVTEMLFALGLGEEIVGVTDYCDYPPEAEKKPKIGGYYRPSVERIISLSPDLVVATADGYNRDVVLKLEEAGIPVYVVNPRTVEGVIEEIERLGKVVGREREAVELAGEMRGGVEAVRRRAAAIPPSKSPRVMRSSMKVFGPAVTSGSRPISKKTLGLFEGGIAAALHLTASTLPLISPASSTASRSLPTTFPSL
ncbi:hypothetical protein DRP77_13300, partial [Candidatus Poribacteria bacterium]